MADHQSRGSLIHVRYALAYDKDSGKQPNPEFLLQAWCLRDRIRKALVEMESPRVIGVRFDPIRMEGCGCRDHLSSILVVIQGKTGQKELSSKQQRAIAEVIGTTSLNAASNGGALLNEEGYPVRSVAANEPVVGPCPDCPSGSICEQYPDGTHGPSWWPTGEDA